MTAASQSPKELALALAGVALRSFLDTGATLDCTPAGPPEVSVLLLVHNRAELTLTCLATLALRLHRTPFEVVVVDNGSTDQTARLLARVRGLRVSRNDSNAGYPRAVNQAARLAAGKYLLMLNNDAHVLGRGIDIAGDYLEAHPDVGAVGGKTVLLDGTLQEGGCILCRDGWQLLYGRGAPAGDASADFEREVDYCSGTFLMTPRELFLRLGGLEEAFSPGYFEDPDYCSRLWQEGLRVVYLPDVTVLHYENATSATLVGDLEGLLRRNHRQFVTKHTEWLSSRPTQEWQHVLSRRADHRRFSVLLLADGLVRDLSDAEALAAIQDVVARVEALDGLVTLWLTGQAGRRLRPQRARLPRTVEVIGAEEDGAAPPLAARAACYDLVVAADADALGHCATGGIKPARALLRGGRLQLLDSAESDGIPECAVGSSGVGAPA
jgi:GT2 family glycosyltransferase